MPEEPQSILFSLILLRFVTKKKKGGAIILVYCFIQFVKDAKTLTLALINILMSSKSETKQTLNSSITQNFEIVSLILT